MKKIEKNYNLTEINKIVFPLQKGDIIFLIGDLGSGKTTISKHILNNLLKVKDMVVSPTYTYYNKYIGFLDGEKIDIYHFDLYKLSNYDEFFAIGAEEIFDNNKGIIIVEWPEIITKYYKYNIKIKLSKTHKNDLRKIEIIQ